MKTGRSLSELAAELDRQRSAKKDYLADTRKLEARADDTGAIVLNGVNGGMKLRPIAHGQMSQSLGIPKAYYDRMLDNAPDLLAANVNTWLKKQPARKLIRSLDNEIRAILSDSYRPLDNHDLAEAILPQMIELSAEVVSCEITDSRLYLKAVTAKVSGEVKTGDVIQAGLVVSNSEVGLGSLRIEELDYRLVCLNGMIRATAVRKAHLGRSAGNLDAIEDARDFFKDETRLADDRAFFLKVRDAAGAMFNTDRFAKRLDQYRSAGLNVIPDKANPAEVIELAGNRFQFNETERKGILNHLIRGGDLSQWGLANAVTRYAQDEELSYDRATELEGIGGDVIELPQSQWTAMTKVTAN